MNIKIKNTLLFMLLTVTSVYGQQHDNVWTFGYTCVPNDSSRFGGTNLFFDHGEVGSEYHCRDIRFLSNLTSSISDEDGNLLLMFNGCTLNDADNELVEGNELLVKNDTNIEQTWWCDDGYNTPHGAMFLPDPYNEDRYYLFYRDIIQIEEQPYVLSDSFYIGTIELVEGQLNVIEKQVIIADTVSIVGSTAIKHANGKDWWIIVKNQNENIYHTILLDKNGVHLVGNQNIGKFDNITSNGNTTKTNPKGSLLASFDPFIGLEILQFDRSMGSFSEYLFVSSWINLDLTKIVDVEFSPSGEFLYVADTDTLWQFDMTAAPDDFFDSKEVVGIYDGFTDPFPTNFWLMQKAPDGKIYMSQRNGSQYLHVIHNPDALGLDCDFRQHDYKLPTVNAFAMPYFPNFRLGPDSTWVATQDVQEVDVVISPNPVRDYFSVRSDAEVDKIELYDVTGNLVLRSDSFQVAVDELSSGIYFCKIYMDGNVVVIEKVVVSR